jgi:hypothetical protein
MFPLQQLASDNFLPGKLIFYGRVLKSTRMRGTCRLQKAARETIITSFFSKHLSVKNINELVISDKLKNNFASLVTSGLGA